MNPRDRRLRLCKSTVRNLMANGAAQVLGGAVKFDTKGDTEYETCGQPTDGLEACTATCFGTCPNSACEDFTCPCELSRTCNDNYTCIAC